MSLILQTAAFALIKGSFRPLSTRMYMEAINCN